MVWKRDAADGYADCTRHTARRGEERRRVEEEGAAGVQESKLGGRGDFEFPVDKAISI